ncbi:MAG: class I SAM-dependent methyltransferase [Thermodesulfobacteriota bacterium]
MKSGAQTYSQAIVEAKNYARWVLSSFSPYWGRRLLEVGLGHGGFRELLPPDRSYIGLDLDPEIIARARARHPDDLYFQADAADPASLERLQGLNIDTVLCCNVLEHIPDDRAAVVNLLALLPPGGHLLLFVPACQALFGELDRLAGHLRRYSTRSLAALAPAESGRMVVLRYFNPLGGLGWWLNGFSKPLSLDDESVNRRIRFFDRFVLPWSRALDPLTRSFFGQSIVGVVEKK